MPLKKEKAAAVSRTIKIVFLMFLLPVQLLGQEIPIGSWRSHLNYSNAQHVSIYQNKVYVASEFGLFYLDMEDNSVNRLTKNDGFSDVGVSAMATIPESKGLIIGYKSGQIDLLVGNQLTSLDAIKQSAIAMDKAINHIVFYKGLAYLATDFGLVALDYQKKEIKESYSQIGPGGTNLKVFAGAIYHDSIFLGTDKGIIATGLGLGNNLMDFHNWRRFAMEEDFSEGNVSVIAAFNNALYAGIDNGGLYRYEGHHWQETGLLSSETFKKMRQEGGFLYVIVQEKLYQLSASLENTTVAATALRSPSDVAIGETGVFYVADQQLGLVSDFSGSFEHYAPDGPFSDHIHKLTYFNGQIAAIERGFDEDFLPLNKPAAFAIFKDGRWENYNAENMTALAEVQDLTDMAYSPATSTLYFSSFGNGILGWSSSVDNLFPLSQKFPNAPSPNRKITAIASPLPGYVFFSEYKALNTLHAFNENEGQWGQYSLGTGRQVLEILSSPLEMQWLRLGRYLLVLDPETGDSRLLTSSNNNLINDEITDFAYDANDMIWYGTSSGIAYIPNPWAALEGGAQSIVPIYENSALFRNEHIDALAIDGGNRKWIATQDGLWLFAPDGDRLIAHFTEANSPLLSNHITDIVINKLTGEVFIATAKGMVSYRSKASQGGDTHQQVKIFPNPVRPGYNGEIGITGLVENAIVKITDLSGNLVRELRALGGTATWDGRNLHGSSVNTGVYLVFSASGDGQESFVGKLAFIR